ncbi:hypothetical protein Moror_16904 [Moniliophthora roreri MCA 2997]|uniref:DUF6593 domain-containing protein n=2 Tax=Moniliophthora roreri TaxID=221103 RepID=V2X7H0_MONRO|nr:hypothetical protein Moror_16904 [Moniliophthora roreri MCA 2997]
MDFLLSKDSVRNCTITRLNGQPAYEVSTPSRFFHTETTTIKKFMGHEVHDMALIELHTYHDSVCKVWGRDMVPKSDGFFSNGKSFIASDGQKYTWKMKSDGLRLRDTLDNTIAVFEESSVGFFGWKSRPAKLSISQAIVDDIIATFVLVEQKRREARRKRNAGGGGGGVTDGGGGGGGGDGGGGGGGGGGY